MEAIDEIKKRIDGKPPKLIFMDVDMPQMDGYETTKVLTKVFKDKN